MANPRKVSIELNYNYSTDTQEMVDCISSFSYSDVASGGSDAISLSLNDRENKWINEWFPEKGDMIKPTLVFDNWNEDGTRETLNCGWHIVDDFGFSGSPTRCKIDAIATPQLTSFKERVRSKVWENTNLKNIAFLISNQYAMLLVYEAEDIQITKVEQNEQDDCSFLNELVTKYGLAMKVFSYKVIIFSEEQYENQNSVAVLRKEDIVPSWAWDTVTTRTYTGAKYDFTDADTEQNFSVTVGTEERVLKVSEPAYSLAEAKRITLAAINNANKNDITMSLTLAKANKNIIATSCVEIEDFGKLNGKYYVEKVEYTVSSTGTKQKLSMRKVMERFKVTEGMTTENSTTKAPERPTTQKPSIVQPVQLTEEIVVGGQYTVTERMKTYYTAAEAKAGREVGGNPTGIATPGTYTIFRIYNGAINITKTPGTPGGWIKQA